VDGTPSPRRSSPFPREEKKLKAKVQVFLKPGVLDVQGKAVEAALHGLGWADVKNVRVGRTIEFDVADGDADKAQTEVKAMCDKLLANTVIESYRVEIA
jgi:phosphoribosylformylglycinamidine synthase